jgi:hypothetical protein
MNAIDALLRAQDRYAIDARRLPWSGLVLLVACGGFVYGVAMGSFGVRPLQALYSGLKVPLLLCASASICLPNFFVLHCVLGLRDDFARAFRAVLAAQAGMSITLAALAPLVALHYAGFGDYDLAILWNGALFLLASIAGQIVLAKHYEPLVAKTARHRITRGAWLALYTFVGIQTAWMLRPFVGAPSMRTTFFRDEPWDNAYVVVARNLWNFWLSLAGAR